MPTRIIKRHDTKVTPRARFLDENDVPLVLTGCTITYSMREVLTGVLKVSSGVATQEDQGLYPGQCFYQFAAVDVDTVGTYSEQWQVTYSSGLKETFPVGVEQFVVIEEDYDNT